MFVEGIYDFFGPFGTVGVLLALFLIFIIDAVLFPVLPELFAVITFGLYPSMTWGALVLAVAVVGGVTGNAILYVVAKKAKLPRWITNRMKSYMSMLMIRDERIILLNRIVPVVPYTGAFIAVCDWDFSKSIFYVALGGFVKYSILILISDVFFVFYETGMARVVTIVLVVLFVGASFLLSCLYRGRLREKNSVSRNKDG
ncbi:MAG: hypothetical protein E3J35_09620 [Methanomassiliicoccales archaeon]|nr:MAG: hypothetical protein E3J35_09620 [Methanomassiliicoccales archaeon]